MARRQSVFEYLKECALRPDATRVNEAACRTAILPSFEIVGFDTENVAAFLDGSGTNSARRRASRPMPARRICTFK